MAAIVDNDVNVRNLMFEPPPEIAVALIAYENLDGAVLVRLTSGLDIDAINLAARSKVILPHFQTTAAVDPDLEDAGCAIPKSIKVSVVNVKVMLPLPDSGSLFVCFKEEPQRVGLVWRVHRFDGCSPELVETPSSVAAPEHTHLPQDSKRVPKPPNEGSYVSKHLAELLISDSQLVKSSPVSSGAKLCLANSRSDLILRLFIEAETLLESHFRAYPNRTKPL